MAMGMTYEQFWEGEATMAKMFREADTIRRHRRNEELWLEGIYTTEALASTVGNMFAKGNKHEYPSEPLPITAAEQQERREREKRLKAEQIKARFMARALAANAKIGGST